MANCDTCKYNYWNWCDTLPRQGGTSCVNCALASEYGECPCTRYSTEDDCPLYEEVQDDTYKQI